MHICEPPQRPSAPLTVSLAFDFFLFCFFFALLGTIVVTGVVFAAAAASFDFLAGWAVVPVLERFCVGVCVRVGCERAVGHTCGRSEMTGGCIYAQK